MRIYRTYETIRLAPARLRLAVESVAHRPRHGGGGFEPRPWCLNGPAKPHASSSAATDRPTRCQGTDSVHSLRDLGGRETFVAVVKGMDDEELVRRVAEGDERALSELYDRYARPVYATGVRLLRDPHLAEELVQDAFTNVWRAAASFDPDRASFTTWLYRLTRNRATDLNRKRRVRPLLAREEPLRDISGGPEPEASVDGWDVARALSRIPSQHREVLTLAYFEGLSQREISRRTGVPLGTIKSQTTAALKRLRQAMGDSVVEGQRD